MSVLEYLVDPSAGDEANLDRIVDRLELFHGGRIGRERRVDSHESEPRVSVGTWTRLEGGGLRVTLGVAEHWYRIFGLEAELLLHVRGDRVRIAFRSLPRRLAFRLMMVFVQTAMCLMLFMYAGAGIFGLDPTLAFVLALGVDAVWIVSERRVQVDDEAAVVAVFMSQFPWARPAA